MTFSLLLWVVWKTRSFPGTGVQPSLYPLSLNVCTPWSRCESDSSEVSVLALPIVSSPGTELSSLGTRSVALSCAPWSSRVAPEGAKLFQLGKTPHLSPCAVGGNEGFEASLPIPVKELRNAKGVCCSFAVFVLPGKYQAEQVKWN